MLGLFCFGSPLATMFGGLISGALLDLEGLMGLQDWRWQFMSEGLGTLVLGVFVMWYLQAAWPALVGCTETIAAEDKGKAAGGNAKLGKAPGDPRLLQFCAIYFLVPIAGYGFALYMPSQVSALIKMKIGLTVGFVAASPRFSIRLSRREPDTAAISVCSRCSPSWSACRPPTICRRPGRSSLFASWPWASSASSRSSGPSRPVTTLAMPPPGASPSSMLSASSGVFAPNLKLWAEVAFGANAGLYAVAAASFAAMI